MTVMLTSILSAGTCASPSTTVATYAYDAQSRRKSKTVGSATTHDATEADNRNVVFISPANGRLCCGGERDGHFSSPQCDADHGARRQKGP
jgi:hypothetical protein